MDSSEAFDEALLAAIANEKLTTRQRGLLKAQGLKDAQFGHGKPNAVQRASLKRWAKAKGYAWPRTKPTAKRSRRPCGAKTGGSRVQSLAFSKTKHKRGEKPWTPARAAAWAKDHGYRARKVDETASELRIRQVNPGQCAYRSVPFGKGTGIRAIMEYPRPADKTPTKTIKIGDMVTVHDWTREGARGPFRQGRSYFGKVVAKTPKQGYQVALNTGGKVWVKHTGSSAWKQGELSVSHARIAEDYTRPHVAKAVREHAARKAVRR